MTLHALQYFLAVAKHKNFTKAAQECFVTQPALSRSIRELEQEMGCQLFARTSRSVMLTAAGERCLAEARRVVNLCARMPEKVRRAAGADEAPLRVGYLIYDHLMTFMRRLSSGTPAGKMPVVLDAQYCSGSAAKKKFKEGELDALLLPEPCAADLEDVCVSPVQRAAVSVMVPRQSPFFDRESLRLEDLRGARFIGWCRTETPLLEDAYENAFREAGVEPNMVGFAEKLGDMAMRVITQNAVGFASTISHRKELEDIRFVRAEGSPDHFGLVFVWNKNDPSPRLRLIRQLLEDLDT